MDIPTWLKSWLAQHPLKETAIDREQYTQEVMARVRALSQPSSRPFSIRWPRLALTFASAFAGLVIAMGVIRMSEPFLADQISGEVELLATLDSPQDDALADADPQTLAEEMKFLDTLVLAQAAPQAVPDDESWIEQTLKILDELDEEPSPADALESSEDDWLHELQLLDENDLAATS